MSAGYHEDDTGLPGALRLSELEAGANRRDSTHPLDFADTEDYYVAAESRDLFSRDSYFKVPLSYRKRQVVFCLFRRW